MKAIEINGEIKIFNKLPKEFKTSDGRLILGLNEKFAGDFGFKDVVTPAYNYLTEELSPIKLVGDVYTYDVIEKPIKETLAELKLKKIRELKSKIGERLSATDWYIIRKTDTNEDIPNNVVDDRNNLRQRNEDLEIEINALTTKKSVVLFEINL
jgi:hypothetical protein